MIQLHDTYSTLKSILVKEVFGEEEGLVSLILKVEVPLKEHDALVNVLPDYADVVEAILDGESIWEEGERVSLTIKHESEQQIFGFDWHGENHNQMSCQGFVSGTPKLKIEPSKKNVLTFQISTCVALSMVNQYLTCMGLGELRLTTDTVQTEMFAQNKPPLAAVQKLSNYMKDNNMTMSIES